MRVWLCRFPQRAHKYFCFLPIRKMYSLIIKNTKRWKNLSKMFIKISQKDCTRGTLWPCIIVLIQYGTRGTNISILWYSSWCACLLNKYGNEIYLKFVQLVDVEHQVKSRLLHSLIMWLDEKFICYSIHYLSRVDVQKLSRN